MQRDSIANTFLVTTTVCLVCSFLVSAAAVGLKPLQEANKVKEEQRNILQAAGMYDPAKPLEELFSKVDKRLVNLETGEYVDKDKVDPKSYDARKAAREPSLSIEVKPSDGFPGFARREKYAFVYMVKKDGNLEQLIMPIYGKGLWSTCYGFLALNKDLETVKGITFYEHGETPGLGGEIQNPNWTAKWEGKEAFCGDEPCIEVIRGSVDKTSPQASHQIDGISGATITSRGVSTMVKYWLGPNGFGPFLKKMES